MMPNKRRGKRRERGEQSGIETVTRVFKNQHRFYCAIRVVEMSRG